MLDWSRQLRQKQLDSAQVSRLVFWFSGLFCLILLIWQTFACAPVTDETAHLASGVATLRTGDPAFYRVNPPLHRLVSAAAVDAFTDVKLPYWYPASQMESGRRKEHQLGRHFSEGNCDSQRTIFVVGRLVRLPFILLGGALLASVTLWRDRIAGYTAGTLWFTSPLVLGHGWTVLPDALSGVATCLLLLCTFDWLRQPNTMRLLWLGVAWGIALGTKFTFAPLFLLWPLMMLGHEIAANKFLWTNAWKLVVGHGVAGLIALAVVIGLYGGSEVGVPLGEHGFRSARFNWVNVDGEESVEHGDQAITPSAWRSAIASIPSPLPKQYLIGVDEQQLDLERGYPTYLLGRWYPDGLWWYYPAAYFIKEQPAAWLGIVNVAIVAGFVAFRRAARGVRGSAGPELPTHLRSQIAMLAFALIGVLGLFGVLCWHSKMALNARYIFPALPLLYLAIGIAAQIAADRLTRRWQFVPAIVCAFGLLSVVSHAPHYYAYTNRLVGGPYRIPPALHDTNFDGGQDLWRAERWIAQQARSNNGPAFACLYGSAACLETSLNLPPDAFVERLLAERSGKLSEGDLSRDSEPASPRSDTEPNITGDSVGDHVGVLVMSRGLSVPARWTEIAASEKPRRRLEKLLVELGKWPPDEWISPTLAVYRCSSNTGPLRP